MTNAQLILRAHALAVLRAAPDVPRRLRLQAGLTQQEIGDALGVSGAAVALWETGERVPSGEHAASYLSLLLRAVDPSGPAALLATVVTTTTSTTEARP